MGISEKLAYLKETKEQIKSALNTPYNVYRDYATLISKYVKNQPKSIVEGSSAICENAIDLPCNVKVNGNSYQETTEGYQLVDESKMTISSYFASYVESYANRLLRTNPLNDGEAVSNVSLVVKNDIPLKNGDYYISCDIRLVSGKGKVNSLQISRSGTSEVVAGSVTNLEPTNVFQRYTRKYTLSNVADAKVSSFLVQFIKTENAVFEVTNFQISPVDKPYEPYTGGQASPNTEYEQDIEVITECSLVQRGKNELDVFNKMSPELSSNGIKYKVNNDGSVSAEGTSTGYSGVYSKDGFTSTREVLKLKANHKYRFYLFVENKKSDTNSGFFAGTTGKNQISITVKGNGVFYRDTTFPADLMLNHFSFIGCDASTTVSDTGMILKAMVVDITNGIPNNENFEPYHYNLIPINLAGNSLAKVGEIADLLNIGVDGSVSIKKNIERLLIPKGSNWYITSDVGDIIVNTGNRRFKNNSSLICNIFKYKSWVNYIYDNALHYAEIKNLDDETKRTVLAQIKETDVEVYSILRDEYVETIPLPSIEPITLFEGTNVFELVTNLGTTMKVEYIVNAETLQNEITELSNAVIELGGTL